MSQQTFEHLNDEWKVWYKVKLKMRNHKRNTMWGEQREEGKKEGNMF